MPAARRATSMRVSRACSSNVTATRPRRSRRPAPSFCRGTRRPTDNAIRWARRAPSVHRGVWRSRRPRSSRAHRMSSSGARRRGDSSSSSRRPDRRGSGDARRETALAAADIARRIEEPSGSRARRSVMAPSSSSRRSTACSSGSSRTLAAMPAEDSPLRGRLLARHAAALQPAVDPEHPITHPSRSRWLDAWRTSRHG